MGVRALSVTHVAGPNVEANGVLRQRCSWCGALLIEYELARLARTLEPGEDPENPKPWTPATWEQGALIRVEEHDGSGVGMRYGEVVPDEPHPDGTPGRIKIPDDACLALDITVTR